MKKTPIKRLVTLTRRLWCSPAKSPELLWNGREEFLILPGTLWGSLGPSPHAFWEIISREACEHYLERSADGKLTHKEALLLARWIQVHQVDWLREAKELYAPHFLYSFRPQDHHLPGPATGGCNVRVLQTVLQC